MQDIQKISDRITTLMEREVELTKAADLLNERFAEVEATLQAVTTSASVPLQNVDPETEPCVRFAFRRHQRKRQLVIVSSIGPDCDDEVKHITSAPLRHRVEAAELLPKLIDRLVAQAEKIAQSARDAADTLNNMMND